MRTSVPSLSLLAFAAGLVAAPHAHAGYYVEHRAEMPNPATQQLMTHTVRSWHEGKKFKRENPLRNETVIIDLDNQTVVGVNDQAKTYWELPVARYQKLAAVSLIVMGVQMKPDGTIIVPDNLLEPTGQVQTLKDVGGPAGKKAYEVRVNGQMPIPGMSTSFWLSEDVDIPIEKMIDELRIALNDPKGPEYKKLFDQWRALKGYPVQSVTTLTTPRGTMTTKETLITWRKEKIAASVFTIPKGYSKTVDPLTQLEGLGAQMKKQMEERKAAGGTAPAAALPPPGAPKDEKKVLPRPAP